MQVFSDPQTRAYARTAGAFYLSIAVFGAFAIGYVPAQIVVAGDPAATLDPTGPAGDVADREGRLGHPVHLAAQRTGENLVLGRRRAVHRLSSSESSWRGSKDWGARARSAASARLACDFTVPTEQPRASAISASLSCS